MESKRAPCKRASGQGGARPDEQDSDKQALQTLENLPCAPRLENCDLGARGHAGTIRGAALLDSGRSDGRCAQLVKLFGQVSLTDIGTEHVKDCAPMVAESDGGTSESCAPRLEILGELTLQTVEKLTVCAPRRGGSARLRSNGEKITMATRWSVDQPKPR